MALLRSSIAISRGLPDKKFRREARTAMIRELQEFLEVELDPPSRPRLRPRLVTAKENMTDEILIKLLRFAV